MVNRMISNGLNWVLGWAGVHGISLLFLHNWVDSLAKPGRYFFLIWPLYIIATVLPLTLQMLAHYRHRKELWQMTAVIVLVLSAYGAYMGYFSWAENLPDQYYTGQIFVFGMITAVCWFVLLPFAKHRLHYGSWFNDYGFLFWAALGNAVRLMSAGIFTGIFWALLGMWAGLFKVLKIDFFADLFTHQSFAYPASALVFGIGLFTYAASQEALVNRYRPILNLVSRLLPLLSGIMLLFLAVLPFKGLEPFWQDISVTALMLGLLGVMIVLFNVAWQDETGAQQFSKKQLWLIEAALLTMPVYIVLSAYALGLRITQYGWSIDRVWAFLMVLTLGVYAVGYCVSVLRRSHIWMSEAKFFNIAGALTLVLLLLLTGTPVLDPARIAVDSQVSRLLANKTPLADFDYQYLRFESGRHGDQVLKSLSKLVGHPQADDIRNRAKAALEIEWGNYSSLNSVILSREDVIKKMIVFPKGTKIDVSFYDYLLDKLEHPGETSHYIFDYTNCLRNKQKCYLISIDLNADRENELIMLDENGLQNGMFSFRNQRWEYIGFLRSKHPHQRQANLLKVLEAGDMEAFDHAWRGLRIGKERYSLEMQK